MPSKKLKPKKKSKPTKKPVKRTPEQRERRRKRKLSAARRKELAKLLKKKSRERGPNPYSAVRYSGGYVRDPTRFTVLTASQMTKERLEMVTSALKTVTTGPEAMSLPEIPGWACTQLDRESLGRVYVVAYLGIEVALFFKRQLTEIIPEPGEKVPEGVLQDPKEAWQRLDLLGRSAEKSNFVLTQTQRRLEESNRLLASRAESLDDLNDDLQHKIGHLTADVRHLQANNFELEKLLRIAKRSQSTPKSKSSRLIAGKHSSVRTKHPHVQSKRRGK
jgi:hypothetical protein